MQRSSSAIASLLGFILIVAHAEAVPAQDQTDGKKYAVLVGINEYAHSDLEKLRFAVRDVTEMDKLLGEAGYTVSLICDQSRNKPTKKVIEQEIKRVLEGCKAVTRSCLRSLVTAYSSKESPTPTFAPMMLAPAKTAPTRWCRLPKSTTRWRTVLPPLKCCSLTRAETILIQLEAV